MIPATTSMSLRRKLLVLLAVFALFAVVMSAAVIYALEWQVGRAGRNFEAMLGRTLQVDRLRVTLHEQNARLRDVVDGRADAVRRFYVSRDEFQTKLAQIADFGDEEVDAADWPPIRRLADDLAASSDRCLAFAQDGATEEARAVLDDRIERILLPVLDSRLLAAQTRLDDARNRTTKALGTTSWQLLMLTGVVAAVAALLVAVGAVLIRRWLIAPLSDLRQATERFRQGDLAYRVTLRHDDELGALGTALNEMAQSVSHAQARLQASETKHRLLFQNLRDAVILCDADTRVVEYHDSDTKLLGLEGDEHLGRAFGDVWPSWAGVLDWNAVIAAAVADGRRHRADGVTLDGGGTRASIADIIVYRVDDGGARRAAIVIRDMTERQKLQTRLRQAETMEAVGTMAGGLAHDFNNLLASVIGSLSLLSNEIAESRTADRLRSVVQTCWQAAALSRRLLNFAGSARGDPQVFNLGDAVAFIVRSLDPSFLEGIELVTEVSAVHHVRMDRDQFTQVVLNMVRNAREAMPDGGTLFLGLEETVLPDPDRSHAERRYAVLVVRDTGVGMTAEAQRRLFEPFFTTKSRSSRRGRGMGMAVVHTAVRNAGGFFHVESALGQGTTFRLHLPTYAAAHTGDVVQRPPTAASAQPGTVLLIEADPVLRDVAHRALRDLGHTVFEAQDASEALSAVSTSGKTVAVIDVDGAEAAVELCVALLEANPALQFVFTTAGEARPAPPALEGHLAVQLLKPFDVESLGAAVTAALGTRQAVQ